MRLSNHSHTAQVTLTTVGEAVWLDVSWSGVTCPLRLCDAGAADSGDRIAVTSAPPPGSSVNTKHPIRFLFASQAAPDSWRQGRGSCRFWLPGLPAPVRVSYVRKSMNPLVVGLWRDYGEVAGADVQPPVSLLNAPSLGRLSIAGSSPGRCVREQSVCMSGVSQQLQLGRLLPCIELMQLRMQPAAALLQRGGHVAHCRPHGERGGAVGRRRVCAHELCGSITVTGLQQRSDV